MTLLSANISFFVRLTIWKDKKLHTFSDKQKRRKMSKFTDFFVGFDVACSHNSVL